MEGHTLLQAIARVNRLHEGKDFGYIIDYQGVLSELNQALDLYGKLPESAQDDLAETLTDVSEVVKTDRKSTRLNSSHVAISYAVFCLKKKTREQPRCCLPRAPGRRSR